MNGVAYYVSGDEYVEPLVVSIWSLSRFFSGPITVVYTLDTTGICDHPVILSNNVELVGIDPWSSLTGVSEDYRFAWHSLNKVMTASRSKYDHTLLLDCDTLVESPIDEIFEHDLVLTKIWVDGMQPRLQDRCWISQNVRETIRQMSMVNPLLEVVAYRAIAYNPYLVNAGVIGFSRHHPFIREWLYLGLNCLEEGVHDEVTVLMVIPNYHRQITLFDDDWNCIRRIGRNWGERKYIRHFVGRTRFQSSMWKHARNKMMGSI